MPYNHPFQVTGFHSCDKEVGLKVLNGEMELKESSNSWDWLSHGVYFWEENPLRALDYSNESAQGSQFNKTRIKTPFVIGAIIELGNCLNLVESKSLQIVETAYLELSQLMQAAGKTMPRNKDSNKALDCAVFQYIHQSNRQQNNPPDDTIRCAFQEGGEIYPGATISKRLHIQVCVINPASIKGYFLPKPLADFNLHLTK